MGEHFDVAIVGAGISGIGAARHLREKLPGKSFVILEARGAIGGTWDLFRYPGIRSDSDMYTLGYASKPWASTRALADGPSILEYVHEAAREAGIDDEIRLHHRVIRADFSSADARWTLTVERTDTGETFEITSAFVFSCTGYYRYDQGYMPSFEGVEDYQGTLIHPQHWPEDLDYESKQVVVIGSGATAVTLVPALAERAAHVTMLQRTPTYIVTLPGIDPLARLLRRRVSERLAYKLVRAKNVALMVGSYQLSRRAPRLMKRVLRWQAKAQLPADVDVDTHFNPPYDPWDQRLCVVPDGDLFRALRDHRVSIVTDRIERFTPRGLRLASGEELEADIVISATGLDLLVLGGIEFSVDGEEIQAPETMAYRGMMFTGVPNAAIVIGYTNASWTLKCDLTCDFVCRVLAHMDEHGYDLVVPELNDPSVQPRPFIDLASGYVSRAQDRFPRQGSKRPWRLRQNYLLDLIELARADLDDGSLRFARAETPALLAR
jgi:monooxygenase